MRKKVPDAFVHPGIVSGKWIVFQYDTKGVPPESSIEIIAKEGGLIDWPVLINELLRIKNAVKKEKRQRVFEYCKQLYELYLEAVKTYHPDRFEEYKYGSQTSLSLPEILKNRGITLS